MSRRPARFTESDVRRAAKVLRELGMNAYLQIAPDGTITIGFIDSKASSGAGLHRKQGVVV
jgi:hypothetical protein